MKAGKMNTVKAPVKKGDLVEVLTGKERGKTGKVIEVLNKRERVLVEKLNFVKRHAKPSQQHRQGGIIEKEASIHWSNVALVCPKCNKHSRKKTMVEKDGTHVRVCVRCGEQFDTAS